MSNIWSALKKVAKVADDVTPPSVAQNVAQFSYAPDVIERGEDIIQMLRSGQAEAITDNMFDMGDSAKNTQLNIFLSQNYDLPMDEASRMARAKEMGFDVERELYHGTDIDFPYFQSAVDQYYSSTNPDVADTYASSMSGMNIPLYARGADQSPVIDAGDNLFSAIPQENVPQNLKQYNPPTIRHSMDTGTYKTEELARESKFQGDAGMEFRNIIDRGPNFRRRPNETQEEMLARQESARTPGDVAVRYYPHMYRSKFARFDPRLSGLKNLSAGVVGGVPIAGLLAEGGLSEEQARRVEDYLQRQGLLY